MRTLSAKPGEVERRWWLVDADGKTLGRIASRIALLLRGKTKGVYTPHVDAGDFVVVINADKVRLTGNKLRDKVYYHHSNFPGGIKDVTAGRLLEKHPTEVISLAVWGMMPKSRLARQQFTKLKVYAGAEHPHKAQNPQPVTLR
jgi:large subunit ribosomal protein L13